MSPALSVFLNHPPVRHDVGGRRREEQSEQWRGGRALQAGQDPSKGLSKVIRVSGKHSRSVQSASLGTRFKGYFPVSQSTQRGTGAALSL